MKKTIMEFSDEQKEKLEAFCKYWKSLHLEDPENFPLEIESGDWDEQFDFFQEEV